MKIIKYTKLHVGIVTAIISAVLFAIIYYTVSNVSIAYSNIHDENVEAGALALHLIPQEIYQYESYEYVLDTSEIVTEGIWQVEIPIINLIGPIHSRYDSSEYWTYM